MKLLLKEAIYWGSFLVFPFVLALVIFRKKIHPVLLGALLLLSAVFAWARFVEPRWIIVREQAIEVGFTGKVVLIADTHLGIYNDETLMKKAVRVINEQKPDYVFIAGDFTYEPKKGELAKLFADLSELDAPVYAVLGNHDVEQPGPPVRDELKAALEAEGVTFMNNKRVDLNGFTLLGLGDNWSGEDDLSLLDEMKENDHVVVLTHNPDTTLKYTNDLADVTLTGHTHCGQIRIPWLYRRAIPTFGPFDKGYTQEAHTKLYITCGLGEVGLPFRLFNPAAVDVITFL